jgi:hypothetical protein
MHHAGDQSAGQSLRQRIATQRSNRAQAAAVEESSHKYDWSLVERRRVGVSSSRSRCCSENGVRRESVAGGRSFKPGPPSRRACVSSTRLESGTRAALIPSMPAHRTAFSCRQDQDETPRVEMEGKKKKRDHHHHGLMCLAEGSARFALVVQAPPHPQRRPRHLDLQRQSVQSRFSGDRVWRRCSILQASFEHRQIFFFPTTFL